MKKIYIFLAAWLILVNVFALLALNRFNLKSDTAYTWIDPVKVPQEKTWNPIPMHAKWDSFWYLDIAQNGYQYLGPDKLSNIVFFPVYPKLIALFSTITPHPISIGWLISIISMFLAVYYFARLIKEFHSNIKPEQAVFFLLIFPTAFFFNTVYTEAIFLFLSLAAFYYTLRKNYLLAGVFGFFAALTRVTGILLLIPVVYEGIKNRDLKKLLPVVFIPFGTICFFAFHYFKFGDFFLFLKVESTWGRNFGLNPLDMSSNAAIANLVLDILFLIFALITTYLSFKKLRMSYGLYMLVTLLVAVGSGTLMSIGRYILVLFPMYLLLAMIKNELWKNLWIIASVLLLAMNITLFVNYYWAG